MSYYYYKDGEKIGPIDPGEFYNLMKWGGDIKPDTIIEWPNGKQLPASESTPPPGSNPLNISLDTARRLAFVIERLRLCCVLVILISFVLTLAAGFTYNNVLIGIPGATAFVAAAVLTSVAVFAHKTKLDKVPPKREGN